MREIRLSGSVRGVRSDPYPYRDVAPTRCRRQRCFSDDRRDEDSGGRLRRKQAAPNSRSHSLSESVIQATTPLRMPKNA